MKTFLTIIFLFVFVFQSHSADYYIDYVSGNDSNNGTSTETPFQYLPWDDRFTGSCTPAAGDNFYFKKGVVYEADPNLAADDYMFDSITSGTAANPITFSSYGSGDNPIIIGGKQLDESQFALYSGTPGSNAVYRATNSALGITGITIQGIAEIDKYDTFNPSADMKKNGGDTSPARDEFYQSGTGSGDYLYIRMSDNDTPVGADVIAIWADYGFYSTGHSFVFESLVIEGFDRFPIYIGGSGSYNGYNINIQNSRLGFCEQGIYSYYGPVYAENVDFVYCINLTTSSGGAISAGASDDTDSIVINCRFKRWENALAFTEVNSSITVRRCFFMDLPYYPGAGTDTAEHAIRIGSAGADVYVYRNIFYNPGNDALFDNGAAYGNVYFWNNTIYEDRGSAFDNKCIVDIYYTNNWVVDIRNNVVYERPLTCDTYTYQTCNPNYSSCNWDYNYYLNDEVGESGGTEFAAIEDEYTTPEYVHYWTLSTWRTNLQNRSAGGQEANSFVAAESTLSDVFISTTFGNDDFLKPKSGSGLIDNGVTINTGENETDYNNYTISDGLFDIGAYEAGRHSVTGGGTGDVTGGGSGKFAGN